MKFENEIREKITEYMDRLAALRRMPVDATNNDALQYTIWRENIGEYHGIIDALLWVIGDESGVQI